MTSRTTAWRLGMVAHQLLIAVTFLAGGAAMTSALLQFLLTDWADAHMTGLGARASVFAAGALCWIGLTYLLAKRVPIRCRQCGGKAYLRSEKPVRYECHACGRSAP
jgi:hypothetical protein